MTIIINRGAKFSTVNDLITRTDKAFKLVVQGVKNGTLRKVIDSETTLMYRSK